MNSLSENLEPHNPGSLRTITATYSTQNSEYTMTLLRVKLIMASASRKKAKYAKGSWHYEELNPKDKILVENRKVETTQESLDTCFWKGGGNTRRKACTHERCPMRYDVGERTVKLLEANCKDKNTGPQNR